jgi:cytoplasmic iron level regulating protein YaaA (DUF328/UPF0246 family)
VVVVAPLLVLVPPSEAKTPGGTLRAGAGAFDEALGDDRRRVIASLIATLTSSSTRRQEIVLNARGALLERALESTWHLADERVARLAAWQRYSGVVWAHLDPVSLEPSLRRRILIPSSLYGITTSEDRIADFRLKMNVGIAPPGTMSTFWRSKVTPVVAAHAKRSTIVNLLPLEHEAAIDLVEIGRSRRVVRVQFIDGEGGTTVGHDAKAVKGILARTLLIGGLESLSNFAWQGWRSLPDGEGFQIVSPLQRNLDGWVTKRKKA